MQPIDTDTLKRIMSGVSDEYYKTSKHVESWVTLRIPVECKPVLDDALKLAYNLVRCAKCPHWDYSSPCINDNEFYCQMLEKYTPADFYCKYGSKE